MTSWHVHMFRIDALQSANLTLSYPLCSSAARKDEVMETAILGISFSAMALIFAGSGAGSSRICDVNRAPPDIPHHANQARLCHRLAALL